METNIRQAVPSDIPYAYQICLKTGDTGQDATGLLNDEFIIGQYFAAPYLHYEIDTCFVLEVDRIPSGYIIGASETNDFNDWMNTRWLPHIRKIYTRDMLAKSDLEKFLLDLIHKDCLMHDYLQDYPSHLHIDLLPIAQKQGFGKKMMHTLLTRMKEKGSKGLHLSVSENNTNAIGFYKKLGFSELKRESGEVIMAISLI